LHFIVFCIGFFLEGALGEWAGEKDGRRGMSRKLWETIAKFVRDNCAFLRMWERNDAFRKKTPIENRPYRSLDPRWRPTRTRAPMQEPSRESEEDDIATGIIALVLFHEPSQS
jgi:hypothetical protein